VAGLAFSMKARFTMADPVVETQEERITLTTVFDGVSRHSLVKSLHQFRLEFEDPFMVAPVCLILSDVCQTLGLTEEERKTVIGSHTFEAIEKWSCVRIWHIVAEGNGAAIEVDALSPS
jgi:hypothetical protein